jgi:hypothetical protein
LKIFELCKKKPPFQISMNRNLLRGKAFRTLGYWYTAEYVGKYLEELRDIFTFHDEIQIEAKKRIDVALKK